MKFSFGIVTGGGNTKQIGDVISSISKQYGPDECEIIVVGGEAVTGPGVVHIGFEENAQMPMHITKKKNIITKNAKHENIVFMHDYIALADGWRAGFEKFGDDFKVCMTKMIRPNGSRYRDWTLDPWAVGGGWLLPYSVSDLSIYQYISGAYWVAKKAVMQEFPLDERLPASRGEDILWSRQVNMRYEFSMNPHSTVVLLKDHDPVFLPAPQELIDNLRTKHPKRGAWNGHP